jgi:hypothetical protein
MYTTEHTLRSIIDSPDSRIALIEALIDGDIKYEGVGIVNRGKFFVFRLLSLQKQIRGSSKPSIKFLISREVYNCIA